MPHIFYLWIFNSGKIGTAIRVRSESRSLRAERGSQRDKISEIWEEVFKRWERCEDQRCEIADNRSQKWDYRDQIDRFLQDL